MKTGSNLVKTSYYNGQLNKWQHRETKITVESNGYLDSGDGYESRLFRVIAGDHYIEVSYKELQALVDSANWVLEK